MSKRKNEYLDSGYLGESWVYRGDEYLDVDVTCLYNGYGELSNFKKLIDLFTELDKREYENQGISLEYGRYDSIDRLILNCKKVKLNKNERKK
jgi:hypothetical protein